MSKFFAAAAFGAATLIGAGFAVAQTPTSGTTLAGGNNGAGAKAASTMKARKGTMNRGAPSAPAGHGRSTEQANGKMRAHKNF